MVGLGLENGRAVALGSLAAASGVIAGALWYRRYLADRPPARWTKVGEVQELRIYPVKSCKGIQAAALECTPSGARLGFARDRSFVLVDDEGKFVTGRDHPKITQVEATFSGAVLTLSCPEFPGRVELDVSDVRGHPTKVLIWDTWTEGVDCGDDAAAWLSRCVLGRDSGIRLLFCGHEGKAKRVHDRIVAFSKMADIRLEKSDGGAFSDAVSYHLISEASVAELNSRLDGARVSALNFRPNLVVKGELLIPFEEDGWQWVKIGDVVFRCLAPCTRCLFTTVDPHTGLKSEAMEPLKALRRYRHVRDPAKRKLFSTPAMGIYLGLRCGGTVSVGDEVFVPQM